MAIEAINPTTGEAVRYDEHGLPRNVEQAELLQPHVKIERIIHLACDDEDLLAERIRGRNTEGKTTPTSRSSAIGSTFTESKPSRYSSIFRSTRSPPWTRCGLPSLSCNRLSER